MWGCTAGALGRVDAGVESAERVSGPDTEVTLCLPFSLLFRQVIFPRRSRGGVAYRYYGIILFEVILVPLRDFLSAV